MKKILVMALTISGLAYCGANAQTKNKVACGESQGKVCKISSNKKAVSCYKTPYAANYKVCKGSMGYYICCEKPHYGNSTHPPLPMAGLQPYNDEPQYEPDLQQYDDMPMANLTAPQSQSYPDQSFTMNRSTSYEGYYGKKNRIKVCYAGENVGELNNAAYQGCATPAYDGPEKNLNRNMNVSTPNANAPAPPLEGRKHH